MKNGDTVILTKKLNVLHGTYLPGCRVHLLEYLAAENKWRCRLPQTLIVTVPATSLRPEATCVYCGCTDSKACPGGCTWVELHQHTPTGVCSGCTASIKGLQRLDCGGYILINPGAKGAGHIWFERKRGEGLDLPEAKLTAALKQLFQKEF